jgi:catechol 2,3-dioxygenase-like lactoylglutathione lyase family enzyme
MFSFTSAFASFSVDDLAAAKEFYSKTLGLNVSETPAGLSLDIGGTLIFVYPKADHQPATFTVLNFNVENIDEALRDLRSRGIEFVSFDGPTDTDSSGVFRGRAAGKGPDIAWFKDPAGNFISILTAPDRSLRNV